MACLAGAFAKSLGTRELGSDWGLAATRKVVRIVLEVAWPGCYRLGDVVFVILYVGHRVQLLLFTPESATWRSRLHLRRWKPGPNL